MTSQLGDMDRAPHVLGREAELAAITELLGDLSSGPRGAVLEGEAGIGKSTVWAAAVERARAGLWTVLSTRGNQSETGMSFAGLSDLLEPVVDRVLDDLAEPQRLALEVAMLRRPPDGVTAGPRELAAATLTILRALSMQVPVLLAIDDVQWVDEPTLSALQFAVRRLDQVPLRVLTTRRTDGGVVSAQPQSATIEGLRPIPIGPVDAAVVRQLVTDRLDLVLPDRVVDGLVAQTGGNPFWALELAATMQTGRLGAPVTIPQSLATLVTQRLDGLPGPTREALLAVSALPQPTIALASRALASVVDDPRAAIDAAVTAGVVAESGGRLRPSHPLLGSAALEALPPFERTGLHARLALIVADDEQRARHTALAARECPDESVAASLDAGAVAARSRGATQAAAELADRAVTFTPPSDGSALARRTITAAELYAQSGDLERAQASAATAWWLPNVDRRRVLPLLVEATCWIDGTPAAQQILRPLLDDERLDRHTRAVATALAADVGDPRDTPRGVLAQAALDLFAQVKEPDPFGLSTALLCLALARLDAGEGIAFDAMDRVAELQRDLPYVMPAYRADIALACWYRTIDDLDRSRTALQAVIADGIDHGDEFVLPVLYGNLALSEVWAGRYASAREAIAAGWGRWSREGGVPSTLKPADTLLRLLTGDIAGAQALIAQPLGEEGSTVPNADVIMHDHLQGLAALLTGDPDRAVTHLSSSYALARQSGKHDPGRRHRLEADLGQALVMTGRLDEATELAKEQVALGERTGRPTVLGVGLRIQGLVLSAQGDLPKAVEVLRRAVAEHERSPLPLERGRSLLALAQVFRRRKQKSEAAQVAQAALDCFVEIGATAFVPQAQAELDRGQRSRSGALFTVAERQVADLVAGGASNREVAAHLFTSVRTVEGHLAAIYRKLGIRSRTELTRLHSAGELD